MIGKYTSPSENREGENARARYLRAKDQMLTFTTAELVKARLRFMANRPTESVYTLDMPMWRAFILLSGTKDVGQESE